MRLEKEDLKRKLLFSATSLTQAADLLTQIDSKFGDGDHGLTMSKISQVIIDKVSNWDEACLKDFFDDLGSAIMAVRGGAAGPLYGTMVSGLGELLDGGIHSVDVDDVKNMFKGSLASMQSITKATIGDKTMMDALMPAVDAVLEADGSIEAILDCAASAAYQGALASKEFVSKFGRARSYKEATLGTPDAGAVSTAIFINGLAEKQISW